MNATIIKKLCEKWVTLSEEEKARVRSRRARQGVRCESCGSVGYFTAICPCSKTTIPEDVEPGINLFWGDRNALQGIEPSDAVLYVPKERDRLQNEDSNIPPFQYLRDAPSSYHTSMDDLTLFQVLRKVIRLMELTLKKHILNLESKDNSSILIPPPTLHDNDITRKALLEFKEYRDYFYKKLERKSNVKPRGNITKLENVDTLYGEGHDETAKSMYQASLSSTSMHNSVGWKSVLGNEEYDAVSLAEQKISSPVPKSNWHILQDMHMKTFNDNLEHLIHVIRNELKEEHNRERRILTADSDQSRRIKSKIWSERLDAADRIIQTLLIYKLSSGAEEADFYIYTLKNWRAMHKKRKKKRNAAAHDSHLLVADYHSNDSSSVVSSLSNQSGSLASASVSTVSTMYKMPRKSKNKFSQTEYFR